MLDILKDKAYIKLWEATAKHFATYRLRGSIKNRRTKDRIPIWVPINNSNVHHFKNGFKTFNKRKLGRIIRKYERVGCKYEKRIIKW